MIGFRTFSSLRPFSPRMLAAVGALTVVTVSTGCKDGDIVDDWGPPAGFTTVQGVVRDTIGRPVAGARVAIAVCDNSLLGIAVESASNQEGRYRIMGALPPVGALPRVDLDTVRVQCHLFAGPRIQTLVTDTIRLQFYRSQRDVVPLTRDIQLP